MGRRTCLPRLEHAYGRLIFTFTSTATEARSATLNAVYNGEFGGELSGAGSSVPVSVVAVGAMRTRPAAHPDQRPPGFRRRMHITSAKPIS
jgi:hypothetical protein